ncbi:MAG: phenylalanine--tRNA ligase beta subunit-related protein [Patescibacteria group bacterium]
MKFKINPLIHENYPQLVANVVIIKNFNNNPEARVSSQILSILRNNENSLRSAYASKEELFNNPYITSYFDLFRRFGVNPKKVRPSRVALTERVVKGGSLPDINPAVNLYNSFSIKYLIPFGGEDLDKIEEYFELSIASGNEKWLGIGETSSILPFKGDLIWKDAIEVSTTSLNYRQCEKTKLTPETTNGYFISEGFKNVNKDYIEEISTEFIQTFTSLLGGIGEKHLLDIDSPEFMV